MNLSLLYFGDGRLNNVAFLTGKIGLRTSIEWVVFNYCSRKKTIKLLTAANKTLRHLSLPTDFFTTQSGLSRDQPQPRSFSRRRVKAEEYEYEYEVEISFLAHASCLTKRNASAATWIDQFQYDI